MAFYTIYTVPTLTKPNHYQSVLKFGNGTTPIGIVPKYWYNHGNTVPYLTNCTIVPNTKIILISHKSTTNQRFRSNQRSNSFWGFKLISHFTLSLSLLQFSTSVTPPTSLSLSSSSLPLLPSRSGTFVFNFWIWVGLVTSILSLDFFLLYFLYAHKFRL